MLLIYCQIPYYMTIGIKKTTYFTVDLLFSKIKTIIFAINNTRK